jgi:hypothetical protein
MKELRMIMEETHAEKVRAWKKAHPPMNSKEFRIAERTTKMSIASEAVGRVKREAAKKAGLTAVQVGSKQLWVTDDDPSVSPPTSGAGLVSGWV